MVSRERRRCEEMNVARGMALGSRRWYAEPAVVPAPNQGGGCCLGSLGFLLERERDALESPA